MTDDLVLPLSLDVRSGPLAMDEGATAPPLRMAVHDDSGTTVDLSTAEVRVHINGERAPGRTVATDDVIEYHWTESDTATPGDHNLQVVIRPGGGDVLKAPSYTPARFTVHRSP